MATGRCIGAFSEDRVVPPDTRSECPLRKNKSGKYGHGSHGCFSRNAGKLRFSAGDGTRLAPQIEKSGRESWARTGRRELLISAPGRSGEEMRVSGRGLAAEVDPERTRDRTCLSECDRKSNGRSPSRRAAAVGFRTAHKIEELIRRKRLVMRRAGLRNKNMSRCGLAPMRNVVDDIVVCIHPQILPIT